MNKDNIRTDVSLEELEGLLGHHFSNRSLLTQALTHRSFVNESGSENLKNNESLEFLGDSVLGFVISAKIYQLFPDLNEGELSKIKAYLVSAANLVQLTKGIRLGEFIYLSRGEIKSGGRKKRAILVDAYEAIIGAVYLDAGVETVSDFIERQVQPVLRDLDIRQLTYGDYKSALQEYLHNTGRSEPVYRVVDELGPDHQKTFVVQVLVKDEIVAEASGKTKKSAQQSAARIALEKIKTVEGQRSKVES
ncbi:MAG: ribonuclease III [Acidobacteriota bacterium]